MKNTKKVSGTTKVGVGIGIGAIAALAAGAYYLYGTEQGNKKRKEVRGWMLKMRGDVLDRLEKIKEVNEETYRNIVDQVMEKYKKMNKVDVEELLVLANDLKKHWTNINKEVKEVKKEVGQDVKRLRTKKKTTKK